NASGKTVATLREEVVRDALTGKLDFLYQVTRTGGGDITDFSTTGYRTVSTDVYQVQKVTLGNHPAGVAFNPGTTPVLADRRSSRGFTRLSGGRRTLTAPPPEGGGGFSRLVSISWISGSPGPSKG